MYIQEENKNRMSDAESGNQEAAVEEQKPLEVSPVVERKPLTEEEFKIAELVYSVGGKDPENPKPEYKENMYYATPAPDGTEQQTAAPAPAENAAAAAEQTSGEGSAAAPAPAPGSASATDSNVVKQAQEQLGELVSHPEKLGMVIDILNNKPGASGGRRTRRRNKKSGKKSGKKSRRQSKKGGKKHRNTGSKKSKKSRRYSSRK
jgi:hypothetical protein